MITEGLRYWAGAALTMVSVIEDQSHQEGIRELDNGSRGSKRIGPCIYKIKRVFVCDEHVIGLQTPLRSHSIKQNTISDVLNFPTLCFAPVLPVWVNSFLPVDLLTHYF